MKTIIGIYGGSTETGGTLPGEDTMKRCTDAIHYIYTHDLSDIVIYLSAGIPPMHPKAPKLAEVMQKYMVLVLNDEIQRRNISFRITPQNPWSTLDETAAMITMLAQDGQSKIIIFSSWYHIWRIKFIWRYIIKNNCSVVYIKVRHTFDLKVLREVGAWVKLVCRIVIGQVHVTY